MADSKPLPDQIRMLDFDTDAEVWPGPDPKWGALDVHAILEDYRNLWPDEYIDDDGAMLMLSPDDLWKLNKEESNDIMTESLRYFHTFNYRPTCDEKMNELQAQLEEGQWDKNDLHFVVSYILGEHQFDAGEV